MAKFRRKKPKSDEGREVIAEPARRSIYDVLQTNLKLAKRNTFIHRLIYIGKHEYGDTDMISNTMEKNFRLTNTGYCTEPLSGVLLYYPNYFCYIVEGSEEALHKHITLLFEHEGNNLDEVKILSTIHHIKGRFMNEWMSYAGKPPQRVEEIDADSNLDDSMRYVTDCCEKLYRFANAFISDQLIRRSRDYSDQELPLIRQRSRGLVEKDAYSSNLPEIKLLRFLINCKYLKTLRQYHRYYEYIGQSRDFSFKSWPAPKNFLPYDIFDTRYDPISNLPKAEGEEFVKADEDAESGSVRTSLTTGTYP